MIIPFRARIKCVKQPSVACYLKQNLDQQSYLPHLASDQNICISAHKTLYVYSTKVFLEFRDTYNYQPTFALSNKKSLKNTLFFLDVLFDFEPRFGGVRPGNTKHGISRSFLKFYSDFLRIFGVIRPFCKGRQVFLIDLTRSLLFLSSKMEKRRLAMNCDVQNNVTFSSTRPSFQSDL